MFAEKKPVILKILRHFLLTLILFGSIAVSAQTVVTGRKILLGETLHYKAKWGLMTIGSATTKSDRKLYKFGQYSCCKIQLSGCTNGLASLFYLNDRWVSFIDVQSITTLRTYRSIREGKYSLDEYTLFDHPNKNAEVSVMNKQNKRFYLKKVYKTPQNIRDVVAGFMMIRLVDLSKYGKGDRFIIDGFYEDTGYKIDVICEGKEYVNTDRGKMLCYKLLI